MTIEAFAKALAELGIVVNEGSINGSSVIYFEAFRAGELIVVPTDASLPYVTFTTRRFVCEALGLSDDAIPVSIQDIVDSE